MFLSNDTGRNHLNIKELAKVLPANAKAGLCLILVSSVPSKANQCYGGIPGQDHILSLFDCLDCDDPALIPMRHIAVAA